MNTHFQNKFGNVSFRLISEVMPVSQIRGVDFDARHKFDIDTAEKIALITENRHVQLCPYKSASGWSCYVVLHKNVSHGAIAEIETLHYTGSTPAHEIQAARMEAVL